MATTRKGEQLQSQRNVRRMTLVERADALVIPAPLLSRPRAIAAFVMVLAMFASLFLPEFRGPRGNPIGSAIVFAICGYYGLLMALDHTVTTVQRDRVVVVHGPLPMWPK
jgi:hypothetical protein